MAHVDVRIALGIETCPNCGIHHGVPQDILDRREREGGSVFCPNGHSWHYTKTEVMRLREELATAQQVANASRQREQAALAMLTVAQKETKRLARRTRNGVCTVCHRTFSQVARHMQTKHPGQKP